MPGGRVVPGAVAEVPLTNSVCGVTQVLERGGHQLVLQSQAGGHTGWEALVLPAHPGGNYEELIINYYSLIINYLSLITIKQGLDHLSI